MAAGAAPARMASASTLLLELDPLPEGISKTRPRKLEPTCGWRRSMITPVDESTPPQKLRGSSRTVACP